MALIDKDISVLQEKSHALAKNPKNFGYAILQGEQNTFYIKKLRSIIGRKNRGSN